MAQPAPTSTGKPSNQLSPVYVLPGAGGGKGGAGDGSDTKSTPTTGAQPTGDAGGSGNGNGNGAGSGAGSGSGSGSGNSSGSGDGGATRTGGAGAGHTGVPTAQNPSESSGLLPGGIAAPDSVSPSNGKLAPGGIAGLAVGLVVFFALLAFLLYRFRKSSVVQRLLAPFRRGPNIVRGTTPGGDGRNLLSPTPVAGAAAGAAVVAAAAAAPTARRRREDHYPPMSQAGYLNPTYVPPAVTRQDSNCVSVMTNASVPSTGIVSTPTSSFDPPATMVAGAVNTSRPLPAPPDPRLVAAANARFSHGSVSSISTSSAISAGLAPGQMAWPMPPGTPPAISHPDGPQYLNFDRAGQTVVRINTPTRGNRR
ncbi:hypothetical protein C8A05DRAFT_36537 [Staphylotrichum tortipilum]|uniref:Uncharacterized protein n=1 Tax=Staphylotrichum tortipilum TaxID=2831512 RepID=A0AAN6RR83_9PEZI|nr:hypothetical protein C8A05DRAFT_36537 [Staphylotrichum longicolle]